MTVKCSHGTHTPKWWLAELKKRASTIAVFERQIVAGKALAWLAQGDQCGCSLGWQCGLLSCQVLKRHRSLFSHLPSGYGSAEEKGKTHVGVAHRWLGSRVAHRCREQCIRGSSSLWSLGATRRSPTISRIKETASCTPSLICVVTVVSDRLPQGVSSQHLRTLSFPKRRLALFQAANALHDASHRIFKTLSSCKKRLLWKVNGHEHEPRWQIQMAAPQSSRQNLIPSSLQSPRGCAATHFNKTCSPTLLAWTAKIVLYKKRTQK